MNIDLNIPDGKSGNWVVESFEVTEDELKIFNLRTLWHPGNRTMIPGKYKRLMRSGKLVMSNTKAEINDCLYFIHIAKGNILLNGLGLGVVLTALLKKFDVKSITVIEKEQDVINLIAPSFNDPRLKIIHADAFAWKPPKGMKYDYIWHDIWDDICADNLPEIHRLHRKYGRKSKWQGSWCRELCER